MARCTRSAVPSDAAAWQIVRAIRNLESLPPPKGLSSLHADYFRTIVLMGLHPDAALELTWHDIENRNGWPYFTYELPHVAQDAREAWERGELLPDDEAFYGECTVAITGPVCVAARSVLARRAQGVRSNSTFVFPSDRDPTSAMTRPKRAWARLLDRVGIPGLQPIHLSMWRWAQITTHHLDRAAEIPKQDQELSSLALDILNRSPIEAAEA